MNVILENLVFDFCTALIRNVTHFSLMIVRVGGVDLKDLFIEVLSSSFFSMHALVTSKNDVHQVFILCFEFLLRTIALNGRAVFKKIDLHFCFRFRLLLSFSGGGLGKNLSV
jgi:hypothetical protein